MRIVLAVLLIVLAAFFWWFFAQRLTVTLSGTLVDSSGKPIPGAEVTVGRRKVQTDGAGGFAIKGGPGTDGRWIVDVRVPGYAPISKVLTQGSTAIALTAVPATTQTANASSVIVARDTRTNCLGAAASNVDWSSYPEARFPQIIDVNGNRVSGDLPPGARRVLSFLSVEPQCSSGFQVSIPASALVGPGGQSVQGEVQIDISTVDLYSADGMPGDYTVGDSSEKRAAAFMESFGAGTITVRSGTDTLQLAAGAQADIVIPVDPGQIAAGARPPPTIPLLQYDPTGGLWQSVGTATLDADGRNYVGRVAHFSEFNADAIKTDPACVRFDAAGVSGGTFDLVVTAPNSSGGFRQMTHRVEPNAAQPNPNLHAVFNLPANDWVAVRASDSGVPIGTWLLGTGPAWGGTGRPGYDYAACGTTFTLSDTLGSGITISGGGHHFGPLPKHITYLVNPATADVYPVGGGPGCPTNSCSYLFSLFDTGSTVVNLDGTLAAFTGVTTTPNPNWDVDVRISGNSVLGTGQFPPARTYNAPGSPTYAAEAHSDQIRISASSISRTEAEQHTDPMGNPLADFVQVSYMLAGAPVTNKVVAQIDYATTVIKGPWSFTPNIWFTVAAPDIEFFQPGAAGIPIPTLTMFLEGFDSDVAPGGVTTAPRHFLQNVTFTEGSNSVFDDQSPANPRRFAYDTGTTFTVINVAMATALGVMPAAPSLTAKCSSLNMANFVTLDSIVIVGVNGSNQLDTYRVANVEVCVDMAADVIDTEYPDPTNPGADRLVDAVIGANLFDQRKILWNGPQRTLSIVP